MPIKRIFNDLREMYSCREYESFIESKLGSDLFINDPDRADRIHKAAESGADGSTHAEIIEDWREFLDSVRVYDHRSDYGSLVSGATYHITQATYNRISASIDACEQWHEKNGSLHQEIG